MEESQSLVENLYWRNDVKAGIRELLGEDLHSIEDMPKKIVLPDLVNQTTDSLLDQSTDHEMTTKFHFEKGKWTHGEIKSGLPPKVDVKYENGSISVSCQFEAHKLDHRHRLSVLFGKVPVINFHTHPTDEYDAVIIPLFLRKYPNQNITGLENMAQLDQFTSHLPSESDIDYFLRGQRRGIAFMIKSSQGTILLVRVQIKVPFQEVGSLFVASRAAHYYERLRRKAQNEFYQRYRSDKEYIRHVEELRQTELNALHQTGARYGFVTYHSADPKSPELTKVT